MKFTLIIDNKKKVMESSENLTIEKILESLEIPSEIVVIKKNGEIVLEEEPINDGDVIEIIKVISGG